MAPPSPPWRVDMRFTASRAHRKLPVTLTASMRWMRSAGHRLDAHAAVDDAGVVHERGHAPELVVHRLEEAHDVRLARHVGLHRNRVAADLPTSRSAAARFFS